MAGVKNLSLRYQLAAVLLCTVFCTGIAIIGYCAVFYGIAALKHAPAVLPYPLEYWAAGVFLVNFVYFLVVERANYGAFLKLITRRGLAALYHARKLYAYLRKDEVCGF